MNRPDISTKLIHFTKGSDEEAFRRLQKIISDRALNGTKEKIKGQYPCVCFSEAPIQSIGGTLCNQSGNTEYSPFGIRVSKRWLFALGGRPVIYQPDREFLLLPVDLRWRHMRYELRDDLPDVDFCWEREWRIRCDPLPFDSQSAQIVVAGEKWKQRLLSAHAAYAESCVMDAGLQVDQVLAEYYRPPFPWDVITLE